MFTFLMFVQTVAVLAALVLFAALLRPTLAARAVERVGVERKRRIAGLRTHEAPDEEVRDVRAAAEASLRFLGLPSVRAGRQLLNVPTLNPGAEGWDSRRMVITASRILARLKQGTVPGDLVEFDGGYALFATNGRTFLLQSHLLGTSGEDYLERQRQDAVEKGDGVIEDFQGVQWKIGTACGTHKARGAGDKDRSTIQVLTKHPALGSVGVVSCLPPNLLDGGEHDYFDMRARTLSGEPRAMIFFFAGGKWSCFMGRELTAEEAGRLQAL